MLDLDRRPMLVFWETTRACLLACRHCRAEAQHEPVAGELDNDEALAFVDSLADLGTPAPVLVLTGGDVLMRERLGTVVRRARERRVPVALSPSVTPLLSPQRIRALGVRVVSISLDGATAATHDGVRGIPGHFVETVAAIRRLRAAGIVVQVNTVVMRDNVEELPDVAAIVRATGAAIWEVFFLVPVGRGRELEELTPAENEDVCRFLADASAYGFVVRTVEGPFFRRVVAAPEAGPPPGELYARLSSRLRESLGEPTGAPKAQTKGTRDGRGIVFVSSTGDVYPAGFLPLTLGNVRTESLAELYRGHPLLRDIRAARFSGRCGRCEFRDLCGGSRARAYASSGDPLAEDPACAYVPS